MFSNSEENTIQIPDSFIQHKQNKSENESKPEVPRPRRKHQEETQKSQPSKTGLDNSNQSSNGWNEDEVIQTKTVKTTTILQDNDEGFLLLQVIDCFIIRYTDHPRHYRSTRGIRDIRDSSSASADIKSSP